LEGVDLKRCKIVSFQGRVWEFFWKTSGSLLEGVVVLGSFLETFGLVFGARLERCKIASFQGFWGYRGTGGEGRH